MHHRLGIEFGAVRIRGTQDNDQVVFTMLFNDLLDTLLTFQVKGSRRRSDKALRLDQQWLSPSALDTGSNGRPLHPIPFP